jgi:UDPglucose 6-dehydrogenase
MNVSVIGSGYVGTTVAACLAELGHEVVNVDIDDEVVASIDDGRAPIHEPRLSELIAEHAGDGLRATTDYGVVRETDLTLVCLPTPSDDDGSVDTSIVEQGARSVGEALASKDGYHVVAVKSTVVPGTVDEVVAPAIGEASGKDVGKGFGVASNPEFLREGSAVDDFLGPDKIVAGASDNRAHDALRELYEPLLECSDAEYVETGVREAEIIKYANNAFLASKISVVNEIANVCKEAGVDSYEVMDAVGLDHRVSPKFMRSGLGWGGSCFPKDADALRAFARSEGYEAELLDAVVGVNDRQAHRAVELLARHVELEGARVAVLGLAFKPETDDVRNSRALDVIELLDERGAQIVAYDPEAAENAREALDVRVEYADSANEAIEDADAVVIATDWDEFEGLDASGKVVVDGRRVDVRNAEVYEGLCW